MEENKSHHLEVCIPIRQITISLSLFPGCPTETGGMGWLEKGKGWKY
jgi:hypothetical protein